MTRRLVASAVAIAAVSFLPVRTPAQDAPRQPGAVYDADKKGETPASRWLRPVQTCRSESRTSAS